MIGLITPTGGRKRQLQLLAMFMAKQNYTGEVIWVIVDDVCPTSSTHIRKEDFPTNWKIIKIFPAPFWREGENTQSRNLLAGVEEIEKHELEAVYIIEDDDYYPPNYLSEMLKRLQGFDLAGETKTVYYNIPQMGWKSCGNLKHASLFQIVMKPEILNWLKKICLGSYKFIDLKLCKAVRNKNLFVAPPMAIGMKGLPGRAGIGIGHSEETNFKPDKLGRKLMQLIPNGDYNYYI